ncbi:thermonuclease family protein [Sphingomonas lacunae]|nr:thermonuclease family protein [Sphingomonas lacunae]
MVGVHAPAMLKHLFAILFLISPVAASAQVIAGQAEIIDGDTLHVAGERIRLHGIDAPESQQQCQRAGANWACGEESTRQLEALVGERSVRCEARDVDRYGRTVAVCRAGSLDLGQAMVQTGMAVAFTRYSTDYVADEQGARAGTRGLWASSFVNPSQYRAENRGGGGAVARGGNTALRTAPTTNTRPAIATRSPSGTCLIKGNINRRGEYIYHMPGMPYYDVTRAERMFCSEAEAQSAGFRRAIVR